MNAEPIASGQMLAKPRLPAAFAAGVRLALAGVFVAAVACGRQPPAGPEVTPAEPALAAWVGAAVCAGCHEAETSLWRGSHHERAMQPANDSTVLGDFDAAAIVYDGVGTRFFRRGADFLVETDGPDGEPAEYRVAWTFGVEPLQQYLLELDAGRVQALSVAWDSRPAAEGGQRWFHLYPDPSIDAADPLHWTGTYQRWNTMCADCHSTGLEKGYDADADRFATEFAAVDVDCEGCHGPGSLHAANPATPPPALSPVERAWVLGPGQRIAARNGATPAQPEAEVCAQCHSRRSQLTDDYAPGDPMLDAYRPVLLDRGLYHADGQILDEVYVYGSFIQSAMAAAGVTCSDCHDPHSARLRAEGNALCTGCHSPAVYDQVLHHRHDAGTAAEQCTACHMRSETYMVVDPRRDHSFRVPRPDLSATTGAPNACNDCHADQTSAWAAARIAEWYPDGRSTEPHFGVALAAGRNWAEDARRLLVALIGDDTEPAVARATGIALLAERFTAADVGLIEQVLDTGDALMQLAAIDASEQFAPEVRVGLLQRFLTDDLRAIRVAAGRALVSARSELSPRRQADLDAAVTEYLAVQEFNSDRPEGLLNRASVAVELGRFDEAEAIYREAIERHPYFGALYVNLSDLYRQIGRADDGEATLRAGLAVSPDDPALGIALGFALVRAGRPAEALPLFEAAADGAPDDPYYSYVRAIAVNDSGDMARALELLRSNARRFPGHRDTLFALAALLRDAGQSAEARVFAERVLIVQPGDDAANQLLGQLDQQL